jgi:hypothetical protein
MDNLKLYAWMQFCDSKESRFSFVHRSRIIQRPLKTHIHLACAYREAPSEFTFDETGDFCIKRMTACSERRQKPGISKPRSLREKFLAQILGYIHVLQQSEKQVSVFFLVALDQWRTENDHLLSSENCESTREDASLQCLLTQVRTICK